MNAFADVLGKLKRGIPGAVLAPMAGLSDRPTRSAATAFEPSFVVSEMIDARFQITAALRAVSVEAGCNVIQIAGCSPEALVTAARYASSCGADAIDINMGCPAKKVTGGYAGSALMQDLDRAARLIAAVRGAVTLPVTVKMRLGWDNKTAAPELARRAEAEGAALVTIHGRTRMQFYTGQADWRAIRAVVDAVRIPVLANGDCLDLADAKQMLAQSGAAGVMIGRGAIGQPWIVGQIARRLAGRTVPPLSLAARAECASRHYAELLEHYGPERGIRHARKHLAAYAHHCGFPATSLPHRELVTETEPRAAARKLRQVFASAELEVAA